MILTQERRKQVIDIIKTLSIYILLVGLTASATLNWLIWKDLKHVITTEKEIIKDIQIKYIEKKVPYFFDNENNQWEEYIVTGYSTNDPLQGTNNIVATGFDLDRVNVKRLPIVASNYIPIYSIIEIEGLGPHIVLDTGLGYKTNHGWEDDHWIDILFETKQEAMKFGRQKLKIRILEKRNNEK